VIDVYTGTVVSDDRLGEYRPEDCADEDMSNWTDDGEE